MKAIIFITFSILLGCKGGSPRQAQKAHSIGGNNQSQDGQGFLNCEWRLEERSPVHAVGLCLIPSNFLSQHDEVGVLLFTGYVPIKGSLKLSVEDDLISQSNYTYERPQTIIFKDKSRITEGQTLRVEYDAHVTTSSGTELKPSYEYSDVRACKSDGSIFLIAKKSAKNNVETMQVQFAASGYQGKTLDFPGDAVVTFYLRQDQASWDALPDRCDKELPQQSDIPHVTLFAVEGKLEVKDVAEEKISVELKDLNVESDRLTDKRLKELNVSLENISIK
jgi:hypothetical protein